MNLFCASASIEKCTALGDTASRNSFAENIKKLKNEGYLVIEDFITEAECDELLQHALAEPGYKKDDKNTTSGSKEKEKFNRRCPQSITFNYESSSILASSIACNIMLNPLVLGLAQSYLKTTPIIDIVAMWWSSKSDNPDSEGAQFYHFDMERPQWLKAFIYLTDVDETSGPHKFIRGSHLNGGIPWSLRKHGYQRIPDDLVFGATRNSSSEISMVGKKGTLILEDTRGLHKGQHVQLGDRLVLQFQYTNSNLGASKPVFKTTNQLTQVKNFPNAKLSGVLTNFV